MAGMMRPLGFSLSLAAQIDEAFGDGQAMRAHIVASVELLERYGHPRALAKTFALSAHMTGNDAHARQAVELLAAY